MQVVDSEGYLKVKLVGGPVGPFVPYTGATANVDLGEYEIKAGQVEFDQTPTGTTGVAVMRWNDQDGTIDVGLKGGNVTLQIGQEQVTRVVNKTGVNLLEANYQAVRVDGAQGNRLAINLAQANNDANSAETLGIVTETINDNQEGFITTSGIVRNIDTTGTLQGETWVDGNILYLSGTIAGQVTNIKPAAPIHTVIMGYVIRAHATQGQIYVKVDNGYELDELHNVSITTPLNDQVLQYESATSLWKNKTISTGITIGTTAIASGTVGRVLFEGTGNVVQESANLFWDNTNNRLGIGTSSPAAPLQITTSGLVTALYINTGNDGGFTAQNNGTLALNRTTQVRLVNGSTIFGANDRTYQLVNIGKSATDADFYVQYWNGASYLERFRVFSTGNFSIGTTTDAGFKLDINGTFRATLGQINFGASHYIESVNTSSTDSSIRLRRTADNGWVRLAFGATSPIQLAANISTGEAQLLGGSGGYYWTIYSNGSERMRIPTSGNVLINTTTDAGFRLDVNGTARVTGNFNVSGAAAITTINPNTITGGTDFFVVKTASLGTYIVAKENGNLILGPTSGARIIGYEALSFSHRSLSSMNFNYGGAWAPTNQLNQAGMYINASYTNAGAGGTSEGAIFQFQGNTATTVGNVTLNQISMKPTYNNTGGTTINRGIFYNPTLTALTNTTHYFLHSTSGRVRFEGLPTSATGLASGDIWNDAGTLKIV